MQVIIQEYSIQLSILPQAATTFLAFLLAPPEQPSPQNNSSGGVSHLNCLEVNPTALER